MATDLPGEHGVLALHRDKQPKVDQENSLTMVFNCPLQDLRTKPAALT